MKKTIAIILVLLLGLSVLAGCGDKAPAPTGTATNPSQSPSTSPSQSPQTSPSQSPPASQSPSPSPEPEPEPEPEPGPEIIDDGGRFLSDGRREVQLGNFYVYATNIPFQESFRNEDTSNYDPSLVRAINEYYVLYHRVIYKYKLDNGILVYEETLEGPGEGRYKYISIDHSLNLYVTWDGTVEFAKYSNGEFTLISNTENPSRNFCDCIMHPSGDWGLSREFKRLVVDRANSTFTFDDEWSFDVEMRARGFYVSENYIYLMGVTDRTSNYRNGSSVAGVNVYDLDGNFLLFLGEEEDYDADSGVPPLGYMGSIPEQVVETSTCFIVYDNHNNLVFFTLDGEPLGAVDIRELLGIEGSLHGFGQMAVENNYTLYVSIITHRPDDDGREILVFKIDGY